MSVLETYIKNVMEQYCFLRKPDTKVPYLPSNVYIEPTNACNLNCILCARRKLYRKVGFLNLSKFKKIIDSFANHNWYPPITLTGNGEPLLNKDLFSMIEYAKEKDFNVSVISNSTLIDEKKAELLLRSGLDRLETMFDSIDKESFEKIRIGASYERTKANIIRLIEMNEQMGHPLFIVIGLIETSLTKKIEETKQFWQSFPIDHFFHASLCTLQADSGMYSEAIKRVNGKNRGLCVMPFVNLSVSYNGDAELCAQDFNDVWVIGNALKDKPEELWNGEKSTKASGSID